MPTMRLCMYVYSRAHVRMYGRGKSSQLSQSRVVKITATVTLFIARPRDEGPSRRDEGREKIKPFFILGRENGNS